MVQTSMIEECGPGESLQQIVCKSLTDIFFYFNRINSTLIPIFYCYEK